MPDLVATSVAQDVQSNTVLFDSARPLTKQATTNSLSKGLVWTDVGLGFRFGCLG